MASYVITTDNMADLPDSYYEEHGIGLIYLSYTIDGKEYTGGDYLPEEEFYRRMRSGSMPTTAQANPETVRSMMEPYLQKGLDVLHIAFSSGLSGSYNSSVVAAEELREKYPDRKIEVVDSLAASLGQGLFVYEAVNRREQGMPMDELVSWLIEHRRNFVHMFTVDDLNHLWRGGRVSRTTAVVGGMLNIKPILHVDDEGKLINIGKVRGRRKSLLELVDAMDRKIGSYHDSCHTVFISHGDCLEDAKFVEQKVRERYQIDTMIINYVGSTIGAHSGPGTLALFFMGDER